MIQSGLVDEGMAVVTSIRERYDGERRNPWNEFECGNSCARSMASYALLNAFSGFAFDMVKGEIGFNPVTSDQPTFRCLWSLDSGWGSLLARSDRVEVEGTGGIVDSEASSDFPSSIGSGCRRIAVWS